MASISISTPIICKIVYYYAYNILFLHIIKLLFNYESGNPKYILMFAGIGCCALAVMALVIVICVKKSRAAHLQGMYISSHLCIEQ